MSCRGLVSSPIADARPSNGDDRCLPTGVTMAPWDGRETTSCPGLSKDWPQGGVGDDRDGGGQDLDVVDASWRNVVDGTKEVTESATTQIVTRSLMPSWERRRERASRL